MSYRAPLTVSFSGPTSCLQEHNHSYCVDTDLDHSLQLLSTFNNFPSLLCLETHYIFK